MKICTKCELPKEIEDFNWRSKTKGTRQSICRECQNKAGAEHYKNNSSDYKKRARQFKAALKAKFAEWLLDKYCVDCGENDPVVLDCDHVRGEKKSDISVMLNDTRPWEAILEELSKCEVKCSNCHRKKTAKQFGWKK
jgi:predicted Fe-S protein YdhL (DUF1289 family)